MKDILIYGAGGFGREIACLIRNINKKENTWNILGFLDDNDALWGSTNEYGKVLGGIDYLNSYPNEVAVTMAIGSPKAVEIVAGKINNPQVSFPNLISPDVLFADENNYKLGKGNIIQRQCTFSCNVQLGDFNALNSGVGIGHDAMIGSFNSFMPAVRISGEVKIGNGNFFGVSSVVLQQIKIGNNIKLAAGSVLMTKPKDGIVYMGIPAKKFQY
jgi:sugar O-acyltransferase (sialic acid O-acetyltransferase NeuD family)